jgi:hypothetical protein
MDEEGLARLTILLLNRRRWLQMSVAFLVQDATKQREEHIRGHRSVALVMKESKGIHESLW